MSFSNQSTLLETWSQSPIFGLLSL